MKKKKNLIPWIIIPEIITVSQLYTLYLQVPHFLFYLQISGQLFFSNI